MSKQILTEEQKKKEEPYGTQLPTIIGAKRHPDNDGRIRDSRGVILEDSLAPKR